MSEDSGVTDNVAGETTVGAKKNGSSKPIVRPKKTPQIKPYSLLNLKSPTYDSSNQLNKGLDPNHKFENYGHGLNAKVRLEQPQQPLRTQITTRSPGSAGATVDVLEKSDVSEKPKNAEEDAAEEESSDLEIDEDEEEEVQAKPIPKMTINKKSPQIKPYSLMSLKSPTYDSSNQLNKAFEAEHHGKPKPLSLGAQMMRKKIHQRPSSQAPKKQFMQSQPASSASKKEEEVQAKPVIAAPPKLDPKSLQRPKFPFSLKNLKSPTYDSSTLLNQAFDPNHKFEDYAHGTIDKVELKKQEMERQELRKKVTSRSDASATSPRSDISSTDSIPVSPIPDVSSTSEDAERS